MKTKKIAITIILIMILIAECILIGFNNYTYAAVRTTAVPGFDITMESANSNVDLSNLHQGNTFDVKVKIANMHDIGQGILVIGGTLKYDKTILEIVSANNITGHNGWNIKKLNGYNESEGIFLAENDDNRINTNGDFLTIRFKVKADAKEVSNSKITITDITSSGGAGLIIVKNSELPISIVAEKEEITSTEYRINDKYISRILPGTTVEKFKSKVTTKQEMVFTDKDGNVLNNQSKLTTGTTLKVGKTLQYTLVVMGDTDGKIEDDGRIITENDLAQLKLHYIKSKSLQGIELMAADYDDDNVITVNDIAIIKLIILGELKVNI